GGYRQPVMAAIAGGGEAPEVSLFEHRIFCGLVGANQTESAEFRRRYRRNANPEIESVELIRADGRAYIIEEGSTPRLSPGEEVELAVAWPMCPTEDECGDGV